MDVKEPKFEWNPFSHMATCIIQQDDKIFYGCATCHPSDFDFESEKTGCEIALYRATIKYLKYNKNIVKTKLSSLKQYFYSINQSKKFNKDSYENKMLQRQIRRLEEELLSYNEEINNLKQYLNEYIKLKDKFYQKIRNKAKNK